MGAILLREVMAGIIGAIVSACGLGRLVCCHPQQAWIVGDQTIRPQAQHPARLFLAVDRPGIDSQALLMGLFKEPGIDSPGKDGRGSCFQSQA